MLRERIILFKRLNILLDLFITAGAFILAYYLRRYSAGDGLAEVGPLSDYLWILVVILPIWWIMFNTHGAYYSQRTTPYLSLAWMVLRVVFWGGVFLLAVLFAFKSFMVSRWLIGAFLILNVTLLSMEKIAIMTWLQVIRKKGFNFKTVLIVGIGDRLREVKNKIDQNPGWGMKVIGFVAVDSSQTNQTTIGLERLGGLEDLLDVTSENVIDEVIFAIPVGYLERVEDAIRQCEELGLKTQVAMNFYTPRVAKTYVEDMDGLPLLTYSSVSEDIAKLYLKRSFDMLASAMTLLILSPVLLSIAVAVWISSPGPILFRQRRIGLNGRPFVCYKFRTMVEHAEGMQDELAELNEMSGPVFKIQDDPRVTNLGRWLRKFSMDELPQLLNVVRGDLSLVGPRPPIVDEVRQYERWHRRRLSMRPGITGIWQVEGRSQIPEFDEWVRLDLQYIDNWSLMLDFKILLKTIPTVILGRGAH